MWKTSEGVQLRILEHDITTGTLQEMSEVMSYTLEKQ